jgi:FkbM family methyltransferase
MGHAGKYLLCIYLQAANNGSADQYNILVVRIRRKVFGVAVSLTFLQIKRELINALWKLLPRTSSVNLEGVRMRVPLRRELDRRVLSSKHEPWMASLLKRILPLKEGEFVDVGANAGQTLLRYKSLCPKGVYVGFEPNYYAAAYVQDIIDLNGWTESMVVPAGIGDSNVISPLFLANPSDLCATLIPEAHDPIDTAQSRRVLILAAEEAFALANVQDPAIIKIDVEGFEAEVLRGLAPVLRWAQPVVICEVLGGGDKETLRARNTAIQDTLQDCGYSILKAYGDEVSLSPEGLIDSNPIYLFAKDEAARRLLSTSAPVPQDG